MGNKFQQKMSKNSGKKTYDDHSYHRKQKNNISLFQQPGRPIKADIGGQFRMGKIMDQAPAQGPAQ
jgi:hypothetical protein